MKILKSFVVVCLLSLIMLFGGFFGGSNTNVVYAVEQGDIELFEDDFDENNGAKWNATSNVVFANKQVTVTGSGPENRLATIEEINATNYIIDFDIWLHSGNINSAIKFGFKSSADYTTRYQITYNDVNKYLRFEKVTNGVVTNLANLSNFALEKNTDSVAHHFQIVLSDNSVNVFVNNDLRLTGSHEGLNKSGGHFLIASQYPAQHYSVDNVLITTSEAETVTTYQVTLGITSDGISGGNGGLLIADRLEGMNGDVVNLTPTANPGYVFQGYSSLLTDSGNSTDGLLTITNDSFLIDDKTGNVTIIAHFVTKPVDPNLLFEDDFSQTLNHHNKYDAIASVPDAVVLDETLVLSATNSVNYLINSGSDWNLNEQTEGYRISLDMKKANTTAGTTQVAFRIDGYDNRYVLVLNGTSALIRRMDANGNNVILANTPYVFNTTSRKIEITVMANRVSVTSNDIPLLSYQNVSSTNDTLGWSNLPYGLALINMTNGAPTVFDNVKVTRISPKSNIKIDFKKNDVDDAEYTAGTVVADPSMASAGEIVNLTVTEKAGYQLQSIEVAGTTINGTSFVMPSGFSAEGFTITANFIPITLREGQNFYVDSLNGNDNNSGMAEDEPWKTLNKVSSFHFVPGDRILLKANSVFNQQALTFNGSGNSTSQIIVGSYGAGAKPIINGQGAVSNVISLYNQEYITIENIEITNLHPSYINTFNLNASNNRAVELRAINVSAKDFGIVHNIQIKNVYIHDINGNISLKWNGGIFFDVQGTVVNGEIKGIPTKYDGVLIEGCRFERVDRSAIKLVSSVWANQSLVNNPTIPVHWYPSTNVIVRSNSMDKIGGDGMTVRDTDGALIEYNLVRNCRYQNTGYNAGIWPFEASNTVIQYNEATLTRGTQDGQGFDCDHLSSYTVMQYNYSHNNYGGFMLIMNGYPHTGPTIRYNISQNDMDKTFEFSRGTPNGTMIYNNTIYSNKVLTGRAGVFDLINSGAGTGNRQIYVFNNIFHYPANQAFYCGEVANMKGLIKLYNNAYYGGITVPAEEELAYTSNPMLVSPGNGPSDNLTLTPTVGEYLTTQLDGYKLQSGSPLIDQGVTVNEIMLKYGGSATDRRHMSPNDLHQLAKLGTSINFATAHYFPNITGVQYDKDFFGNPLSSNGSRPDIGAMEYQY